jgi:hypothetical protein
MIEHATVRNVVDEQKRYHAKVLYLIHGRMCSVCKLPVADR